MAAGQVEQVEQVERGDVADSRELLRARYEAYCAEQAAALPGLLPRAGLRALYREARSGADGPVEDPLALLVARCRSLLPLPPFEVWVADYLRNRRPYLEAFERGVGAPPRDRPVVVDLRTLDHQGASWYAGLFLFHEDPFWRAFITFRPEAGGTSHRTADVFREETSEQVRERFRSFSAQTLQAFLRSALP